jgi:AraC-like DNA-binding protein
LFQTQIRKLIVKHLPSGEVGIERIARELHLNRGMIYRKLKEENTSYKDLLTSTRKQLATQYLKNPSLTIDMISSQLGYTESSAFKRAFKSWFGINPGQYRKENPSISKNLF